MVWIGIPDRNSVNTEEYFVTRQVIYLIAGLTEDQLSSSPVISVHHEVDKQCNPHITPVNYRRGEIFFIFFLDKLK